MHRRKVVLGIVLIVLVGGIMFSEMVKPIGMIGNIKKALGEIMQSSNSGVSENITTIDVTGIELRKETRA